MLPTITLPTCQFTAE